MRTMGIVISFKFDYSNRNNKDLYGNITSGIKDLYIVAKNPETQSIECFKAKNVWYEFPAQYLYEGSYVEVSWPDKFVTFVAPRERILTPKDSRELEEITTYLKSITGTSSRHR